MSLKAAEEERKQYKKGKKRLEKAKREEQAKRRNVSKIRQKLFRRLRTRTVPVDFGDFTVDIRLLSPAEQSRLSRLQAETTEILAEIRKHPEKAEGYIRQLDSIDSQICRILENLCVDPGLNYQYWRAGKGFNVDVPAKILSEAVRLSSKTEQEIRFLQRNRKGKPSSSSSGS